MENEDLKAKVAAQVEKQILREFEQMKAEKKILEQTVLHSSRRHYESRERQFSPPR